MDYADEGPPRPKKLKTSLRPTLISLKGQVAGVTHVLGTTPRGYFYELLTEDSGVVCIFCKIKPDGQLDSLYQLQVGKFYKISNVVKTKLTQNGMTFRVYVENAASRRTLIDDLPDLNISLLHCSLTTVIGEVTSVDEELGIYGVNNSLTLVIGTLRTVAVVPFLKLGQFIIVHKAHRVTGDNEEQVLVMCARSFLEIDRTEGKSCYTYEELSPILQLLKDKNRGFKVILWLRKCRNLLKRSFSDAFLASKGILPGCMDEFRSSLLLKITKLLIEKDDTIRRFIVSEAISSEHYSCPVVLGDFKFKLRTIQQSINSFTPLGEAFQADGVSLFWQSDQKEGDSLLVALLSVTRKNHRLTLEDATESVSTVVYNNSEPKLSKDLLQLLREVVLVRKYQIVRERFQWETTENTNTFSENVELTYLMVSSDNIDVINGSGLGGQTQVKQSLKMIIQTEGTSRSAGTLQSEGIIQGPLTVTLPSMSLLTEYWSQLVLVLQKPSLHATDNKTLPSCNLIVERLGPMVKIQGRGTVFPRDVQKKGSIIIVLEKATISAYPLMTANTVYELRFPISTPGNFFQKLRVFEEFTALKTGLPARYGVTAPQQTEIYLVDCPLIPVSSLAQGDNSVLEAVTDDVNSMACINLIGYIASVSHDTPKFDREKISIKRPGFGVPGSRIKCLSLRNTASIESGSTSVLLFLTYRPTLQYPLGLVEGAKLNCRFITKVKPRRNSEASHPYFRDTKLSSFEVLEGPVPASEISFNFDWGSRSVLSMAWEGDGCDVRWNSISMVSLQHVSIEASCSSCKSLFKDNVCEYVGCSSNAEPMFFSRASFTSADCGAEPVIVFVPDKYVQELLGASQDTWKSLTTLAKSSGELNYSHRNDFSTLDRNQKIFHLICKRAMNGRRLHMLCRPSYSRKEARPEPSAKPLRQVICKHMEDVKTSRL